MSYMFKVDTKDFSDHVVAKSYKVNNTDVFDKWTDANGTVHRNKIRNRVSGTFDMIFTTLEDYDIFYSWMISKKSASLTYPITIMDNISNSQATVNAFVDWTPSRFKKPNQTDGYEIINVKIEEA